MGAHQPLDKNGQPIMDDPGLIFFEEVSCFEDCVTLRADMSPDKICYQHDLYCWARTRQVVNSNPIQDHLRRTQIPYLRIHRACVCGSLDHQLHILASVYVLPYHCLYRALLREQLRRDRTNVFSTTCKSLMTRSTWLFQVKDWFMSGWSCNFRTYADWCCSTLTL